MSSIHLQDMSSRPVFKTCLQDVFSVTIFRLPRRLQDFFKTSWRRLQNVLKRSRKRSSRRLGWRKLVTLKTRCRRLQDQQMFAGFVSITVTFILDIVAIPKITTSYCLIIFIFFFKKGLNISNYFVINCFIFFVHSKRFSFLFSCTVICFFS